VIFGLPELLPRLLREWRGILDANLRFGEVASRDELPPPMLILDDVVEALSAG